MITINLDTKTLNIVAALSTMVFSTVALSLNFSLGKSNGIKKIASALGVVAISYLLTGLRGDISDFMSVVLANSLFIIGAVFLVDGFCSFNDVNSPKFKGLLVVVPFLSLTLLYLTYIQPSILLRSILVSSTVAVILLTGSDEFRRSNNSGNHDITAKLIRLSFSVMAITLLIRAALLWLIKAPEEVITSTLMYQISYISWVVCSISLTVGLLMLVTNKREAIISKSIYEDALTPFYNRKILPTISLDVESTSNGDGEQAAVLMCDIDNFKTVNDLMGHLTGDCLIKSISSHIMQNLRSTDIPIRYGGDEFLIFLPNTNATQAVCVAERIRKAIDKQEYMRSLGIDEKISVSIGISETSPSKSIKEVISNADKALYRAKIGGRNCVRHETALNV